MSWNAKTDSKSKELIESSIQAINRMSVFPTMTQPEADKFVRDVIETAYALGRSDAEVEALSNVLEPWKR